MSTREDALVTQVGCASILACVRSNQTLRQTKRVSPKPLSTREGLVSDLYLTTSPISAGTPGTPFYEGPPVETDVVVEKRGRGREAGVRFQHLLVK